MQQTMTPETTWRPAPGDWCDYLVAMTSGDTRYPLAYCPTRVDAHTVAPAFLPTYAVVEIWHRDPQEWTWTLVETVTAPVVIPEPEPVTPVEPPAPAPVCKGGCGRAPRVSLVGRVTEYCDDPKCKRRAKNTRARTRGASPVSPGVPSGVGWPAASEQPPGERAA